MHRFHAPSRLTHPALRAAWLVVFLTALGLANAQAPGTLPDGAAASVPALVTIDAANALRSYDAEGRLLQDMPIDRQRAVLTGGVMFAAGKVWVTYERLNGSERSPAITAFNAQNLKPLMLHRGAFQVTEGGDPGRYTGVAFDPTASEYYVATDRLGVLVFDRAGKYLPRAPEANIGVTGISFDASQAGLWGVTERHAIVRFERAESAPGPGIDLKFPHKKRGQEPVALAVCRAEGGGGAAPALIVLFRTDRHGSREGTARAFDLTGQPVGAEFDGKIVNPHGIACTAHGDVYIAADNGLLAFHWDGSRRTAPGVLATLTTPVLGVAAAP